MARQIATPRPGPTTPDRRWMRAAAAAALLLVAGCGRSQPPAATKELETLARTEFTERIENFFEHEPLTPGKPSRFLIHLTDLSDGSPVEKADVTLTVRPGGGGTATTTKARVGRVTGIYVAELTVPGAGAHAIDFHVKNAKLDERMSAADVRAR